MRSGSRPGHYWSLVGPQPGSSFILQCGCNHMVTNRQQCTIGGLCSATMENRDALLYMPPSYRMDRKVVACQEIH